MGNLNGVSGVFGNVDINAGEITVEAIIIIKLPAKRVLSVTR
ncbi:hypothetical protein [Pectobacterium carotovorum]